jgi:hypothetical protein
LSKPIDFMSLKEKITHIQQAWTPLPNMTGLRK